LVVEHQPQGVPAVESASTRRSRFNKSYSLRVVMRVVELCFEGKRRQLGRVGKVDLEGRDSWEFWDKKDKSILIKADFENTP
jgi:hypothetical protein